MLSSCRGRRRCGSCVLAAREAFLQKMWLDTSSAQKSVASGVLSFNPVPMLAHTTSTAVTATAMVMDITFCYLPFPTYSNDVGEIELGLLALNSDALLVAVF